MRTGRLVLGLTGMLLLVGAQAPPSGAGGSGQPGGAPAPGASQLPPGSRQPPTPGTPTPPPRGAEGQLPPGSQPPPGAPERAPQPAQPGTPSAPPEVPPTTQPPAAHPPGAEAPVPGAAPAPGQPGTVPTPGGTPAPAGAAQTLPPGVALKTTPPFGHLDVGTIVVRLSLEEAIQWAMSKSLTLVIEELNRDMSNRELVIARATFDPFFNLSATYSKNRDPSASIIDFDPVTGAGIAGVRVNPSDITTFRGGVRGLTPIGTTYQVSLVESRFNSPEATIFVLNPRYSSRAEATLTQPLLKDAWSAVNTASIKTAEINIDLARQQLEITAINTVTAVEAAYWDLVFAIKNYDSKQKALEVSQEQLRIDQRKFEVGTRAKIDVTTTEAQVARRQTEYDLAAALRADARDQLLDRMNYIGLDESLKGRMESGREGYRRYGDIEVVPTTEPNTQAYVIDRSVAVRSAFDLRPEYRQANLRLRSQEIAISVAKNQMLPALDLTASWFQLGLDDTLHGSADSVFDGDFYDWSVGALFEIPLSLRGPRARYQNARDFLHRLKAEKQSLENIIVLEVDKAIRDLEYAYRAVLNLHQQVVLQEELLRAERVRLDVGKSIAYTVAQIENDLVAVQAQELRAKADYEITKAFIRKAVGQVLRKWNLNIR